MFAGLIAVIVGALVIPIAIVVVRGVDTNVDGGAPQFPSASGVTPEDLTLRLLVSLPDGSTAAEPDATLSVLDIAAFAGPDAADRVRSGLVSDGIVAGRRRVYAGVDGTTTRIEVYQFASVGGAVDARRWAAQPWLVVPGGSFELAPVDLSNAVVMSTRVRDVQRRLERGFIVPVGRYLVIVDVQGIDIDANRDQQIEIVRRQLASLAA